MVYNWETEILKEKSMRLWIKQTWVQILAHHCWLIKIDFFHCCLVEPGRLQSMGSLRVRYNWVYFHFSLSCTGEGNDNSLQYSCLENPMDGGAWWATVHGVTQTWTLLKWLSSSNSPINKLFSTIFLDSIYMHWNMIFIFLFLTYFTLYKRF